MLFLRKGKKSCISVSPGPVLLMAVSDVFNRDSLLEEESISEVPVHPPVIKAGLLRAKTVP